MSKYYTAFVFGGTPNPRDLHCTHKYLGEQSPERKLMLIDFLQMYFEYRPFQPFNAYFNERGNFGPEKNIQVLISQPKPDFRPTLRHFLSFFRLEEYLEYAPHISLLTREQQKWNSYQNWVIDFVLVEDGQVVWSAVEYASKKTHSAPPPDLL